MGVNDQVWSRIVELLKDGVLVSRANQRTRNRRASNTLFSCMSWADRDFDVTRTRYPPFGGCMHRRTHNRRLALAPHTDPHRGVARRDTRVTLPLTSRFRAHDEEIDDAEERLAATHGCTTPRSTS